MFADNSKVFINYDNTAVKYDVDPSDLEVTSWVDSGNTIIEYPYGDFETKGDPNA
jgi:hypothetical protein